MKRLIFILLFFLTGCSNAPIADFLDLVSPGRIRGRGTPVGGVCQPDELPGGGTGVVPPPPVPSPIPGPIDPNSGGVIPPPANPGSVSPPPNPGVVPPPVNPGNNPVPFPGAPGQTAGGIKMQPPVPFPDGN